jgi:hypothetical protein
MQRKQKGNGLLNLFEKPIPQIELEEMLKTETQENIMAKMTKLNPKNRYAAAKDIMRISLAYFKENSELLTLITELYNKDDDYVADRSWVEEKLNMLKKYKSILNKIVFILQNEKVEIFYQNNTSITSPDVIERIHEVLNDHIEVYISKLEKQLEETHDDSQSSAGGASSRKRLEKLTVKELQHRCIKRKIPYSGKRKAELIALLRRKK